MLLYGSGYIAQFLRVSQFKNRLIPPTQTAILYLNNVDSQTCHIWGRIEFQFSSSYYSFLGGFSQSSILRNRNISYTNSLISFFTVRSRFIRCWHAPSHGCDPSTFHRLCDGRGPTVTIIRVGSYIFGGYTDKSWTTRKYFIIVLILQLISTSPRCEVWNRRTRV